MRVETTSGAMVFPIFLLGFAAFWTAIVSLLGAMSGWYGLAQRFPDRCEHVLLKMGGQSGTMGMGVSLGGILTLEACASGLRVSIWRIFGPFSRPFFVPWEEIREVRRKVMLFDRIELHFGRPEQGSLSLFPFVWQMLQTVRQVELGRAPTDKLRQALKAMFLQQWLIPTIFAAVFFSVVPRLMSGGGQALPVVAAVAFPAVVFGISPLMQYLRLRSRL